MTNPQDPGGPIGHGPAPTGPPALPFDPRVPVAGSPEPGAVQPTDASAHVHAPAPDATIPAPTPVPSPAPGFSPQGPGPQAPPVQTNAPPVPSGEGSPSKKTGWLIGAGLTLVVLAGMAFFAFTRGDDTVAAGDGPTTTEVPSADSPTTTEDTSGTTAQQEEDSAIVEDDSTEPDAGLQHIDCPSETPADLCDLAVYVETVRGRPFKTFPVIELEENDEFDRRLLALFDEDSAELATSGHVLSSLGMIPADADLVSLMRKTLEIGVVGYYDTDTQGLVVRGAEFDLYSKLVLVHELTHAHDDQWIGLDRPELEEAEDESEFGFLAITEGNASRVDDMWRSSLSGSDQAELSALELSALSPEDIEVYLALPPFILQMQFSPYVDGAALVENIFAAGGEAAIDAAFEDPPQTSEQVLHPRQYLTEDADELPPFPVADGDIIDQGVLGELSFRIWLGERVGEGWGGDRYVTWLDGAKACTRVEVQADDARDLEEFSKAAVAWADEAPDRSVEDLEGLVRMTGCA